MAGEEKKEKSQKPSLIAPSIGGFVGAGFGSIVVALMIIQPFGTNDPHGDNPNVGLGSPPTRVTYKPNYLGITYIKFENDAEITIKNALFDTKGSEEADKQEALRQLDCVKNEGSWCKDIKPVVPYQEDFNNYSFPGQTRIFIDVMNANVRFDDAQPILFTKYLTGYPLRKADKNKSFYNAEVLDTDDLSNTKILRIDNYHSKGTWLGRRSLKKPNDISKPGMTLKYSMNIHLKYGAKGIPIVVDPDTGNGTDPGG